MNRFIHLVVRRKAKVDGERQYSNIKSNDPKFMLYTDWESCFVAGNHIARTRFHNSDFRGSNLRNATIHFLDLTGADLSQADLSSSTRFVACTVTNVKWPKGYDPRLESCWDANFPQLM